MNRKQKDFWVLVLFYANLVIYVGGDIYLRFLPASKPFSIEPVSLQLSEYDDLIHKHAQRNGLDWRLVYSIIETESSFRSNAVSSAGAVGLMQILPVVAKIEGVQNMENPEENIRAGVRHFKRYFEVLRGETADDTLKINLAAYNAGIGHVRDAMKLAAYMGMNPRQWKSLEIAFPLLEDEQFHPFVQYGYCQGNSVVSYVKKVIKRYNKYRALHPDFPLEIREAQVLADSKNIQLF